MKLDKFTVKSQEAVQAAVSLAEQFGNQEIQPEYLLKAVLEQPEGVHRVSGCFFATKSSKNC